MGLAASALACGDGPGSQTAVYSSGPPELRGTVYSIEIDKPSFSFPDTDGHPFDFSVESEGNLTFLFFGFTSCPDVCPVHMSALASAISEMPLEDQARTTTVFVSVDPERDTPERIRAWLDEFDDRFIGLIPTMEQANAVLGELMMAGAMHVPREDGTYDVVHPAAVIAFSPGGQAVARYGFGTRRADWAHDLPLLLAPR